MKRITICGASGLKNIGDEAILYMLLKQYNKKEQFEISVISFDKNYTERLHHLNAEIQVVQNNKAEWKKQVRECDIFILGGGGLFQDETTFFNVNVWLSKLKYALKKNKKTYIYANSFGPINYKINERALRKILPKVDVITVRDALSYKYLKSIGVEKNLYLTADPVFGFDIKDASNKLERYNLPEEYICVSIRHWFDTHPFIPVKICTKLGIRRKKDKVAYEKYIQAVATCVEYFNRQGKQIVFLSFFYNRDTKIAEDIQAQLSTPSSNMIVNREYIRPEDVVAIIKKSSLLVGMRLHSVIMAILAHTPVAVISYSQKVKGIVELAGLDEYCIDVNGMTGELLVEVVQNVEKDNAEIINKEEKFTETMKEKEAQNKVYFDKIIEHI